MSGKSLTVSSVLKCPHGAAVQIVGSNARVKGPDGYLALATDTFTISGCPFQIPAAAPIPSPCVTVLWLLTDMRDTVNGAPTLSESSVGLCMSAMQIPQGPVVVSSTQSSVSSE